MTVNRLNMLALMNAHKNRLETITSDHIMKEFTSRAPRYLNFGESSIDLGSFCLSYICHIQKCYY